MAGAVDEGVGGSAGLSSCLRIHFGNWRPRKSFLKRDRVSSLKPFLSANRYVQLTSVSRGHHECDGFGTSIFVHALILRGLAASGYSHMQRKRTDSLDPRKKPRQRRSRVTVETIFEATIQALLANGW
jgi:hypothetical protein